MSPEDAAKLKAHIRSRLAEIRRTMIVIQCQGFANGSFCPYTGQYLEWVKINDPIDNPLAAWTSELAKAMRFTSPVEAMETWKIERTVDPPGVGRLVPDGKPNRPLTAFNVSFEHVDR